MFGLFKKKAPPPTWGEELFLNLRPFWFDTIQIIESVEGPFVKKHEAGLFVAVVTMRRLAASGRDPSNAIADEFAVMWLVYLADNPHEPECPDAGTLSELLITRFSEYKQALNAVDDFSKRKPDQDPEVQLTWAVFSNCTGVQAPKQFTQMMTVVPVLYETVCEVEAEVDKLLP